MKRTLPIFVALASAAWADPAAPDLLRFGAGDQLSGSFTGFDEQGNVVLTRPDLKEPALFKIEDLERIALRGGAPAQPSQTYSHAVLRNGDRIPGNFRSIDASSVVIETPYAGTLTIPRKDLLAIRPNPPGGGALSYMGPFRKDDWLVFPRTPAPENPAGQQDAVESPAAGTKPQDGPTRERTADGWHFDGNSWYWAGGKSAALLALPDALPDRFVCTMDLEWTGAPQFAIGFHADMEPLAKDAKARGKETKGVIGMGRSDMLGRIFGNSYLLSVGMHQSYLANSGTKNNGNEFEMTAGMQGDMSFMRPSNRCTIAIRADRAGKRIVIDINGRRKGEWIGTTEEYKGSGKGLCFAMLQRDTTLRISDLRISAWNGILDPPHAVATEGKEMLLLTNGTDRIAGSLAGTNAEGVLSFKGAYGDLSVPMEAVEELCFAMPDQTTAPERKDGEALLRLGSLGAVSGMIKPPGKEEFTIVHPLLGELRVRRDAVLAIEFEPRNPFPGNGARENFANE